MSLEPTVIEQDILTVESGIICHQVNCRGRMGSGIALSIATKFPSVHKEYLDYCDRHKPMNSMLGHCQICTAQKYDDGFFDSSKRKAAIYICNIFGQDGYGRDKQYTDYDAVDRAFGKLGWLTRDKDDLSFFLQTIYIPWKMGCDRGGGDWDTYRRIIEKHCRCVVYCKLPGVK